MLPSYEKVKGIHPGAILKRELKKRQLKSIELAKSIDEYPQTINAITNERRGINPKLSIKLGYYFGISIDYFMLLQAAFEVYQQVLVQHPPKVSFLQKIRTAIFWDTDVTKVDVEKHKRAIIQRILERGNKAEIKALIDFYGLDLIKAEISYIGDSFVPSYEKNISAYIYNS